MDALWYPCFGFDETCSRSVAIAKLTYCFLSRSKHSQDLTAGVLRELGISMKTSVASIITRVVGTKQYSKVN